MSSPEKEKTMGQIFKEKFGYSKTMARNMKKAGVETPEEYRKLRNKKQREKRVARRKKHELKRANRGGTSSSNPKKK